MTPAALSLLGGFGIGLLGSVHCVGMCGGIAAALAMAAPARGTLHGLLQPLLLGAGRILGYALAGLLAGSLGLALADGLGAHGGLVLRGLAGLLLVLIGLYVTGWWHGLGALERIGARLWGRLAPTAARLRRADSPSAALLLGILWGWLPCGLVYSALALAATAGDGLRGAALMAAFGAGTLPATLASGLLARRLARITRAPAARRCAGALLILFGLWTVTGGAVMSARQTTGQPCHASAAPE